MQVVMSWSKSSTFIIGRDVTFDENFMLQLKKGSIVDETFLEEASKQVEFKSKDSGVHEKAPVELVYDA